MGEEPARQLIDHDSYDFVADKGPITALGLDGEGPETAWFKTFRIFGLRKGYSAVAGLPGHYLVNSAGMAEGNQAHAADSRL